MFSLKWMKGVSRSAIPNRPCDLKAIFARCQTASNRLSSLQRREFGSLRFDACLWTFPHKTCIAEHPKSEPDFDNSDDFFYAGQTGNARKLSPRQRKWYAAIH